MSKGKLTIPRSATLFHIGLVGVLVYFITVYFLKQYQIDSFWASIISICSVSSSMIILEKLQLRKQHKYSSGIDFSNGHPIEVKRVLVKLLGLYGTLGFVAVFYWVFPEYNGGYYSNYFRLIKIVLPIILLGSLPYFFILDRFMKEPKDSHWHAGKFFLLQWREINWQILKFHFLGWLVKAFFLALMFTYLMGNTGRLLNSNFGQVKLNFGQFYDYMYNLLFTIDLLFVSAGYLLTLKIFDSHIRTAEPSFLGWMVALSCYQPFWSLMSKSYLGYDDSYFWGHMLADNFVLYRLWGSVILLLLTIYVLATIVFGVRFSNLTNRGIITNGPYRFMKHPAYISKNISWWLISIPFISSEGFGVAMKHCLLLLAVNFIYYLRARTEERHLSLDPTYVKYATAMNSRGLFRRLYGIFPKLKYNKENYIKEGEIKKLFF